MEIPRELFTSIGANYVLRLSEVVEGGLKKFGENYRAKKSEAINKRIIQANRR